MANICDQQLYIAAASSEDMLELLSKMAANFEQAVGFDPLAEVEEPDSWEECAEALSDVLSEYNGLHLLCVEPDARSESNWLLAMPFGDKPCININLCLKWGPSLQLASFCAELDGERFGHATINGGEYMCAMEDETAFIQWGNAPGDMHDNPLGYEEFAEWKGAVIESEPESLNETALKMLFTFANEGTFFWEAAEGDDDREDEDE